MWLQIEEMYQTDELHYGYPQGYVWVLWREYKKHLII